MSSWYSIAELPAEGAEVGPGVLPGAVPPVGACLHHELELLVADASVLVGVDVEDGLLVAGSERVPDLVQLDESAAVLVEVPERRRQVVVVGHLPEGSDTVTNSPQSSVPLPSVSACVFFFFAEGGID
jgi:hypothetical protein